MARMVSDDIVHRHLFSCDWQALPEDVDGSTNRKSDCTWLCDDDWTVTVTS